MKKFCFLWLSRFLPQKYPKPNNISFTTSKCFTTLWSAEAQNFDYYEAAFATTLKLEHHKLFLADHFLSVSHPNLLFDTLLNKFSVPQGSNLCPLLFLTYVNGILNALNSNPRLFADNTCFNINTIIPSILSGKMNQEIILVHIWTIANKTTVNTQKSLCFAIIPKRHLILNISIYFNDSVIKINVRVRYFGITLDNKLNFEQHMDALATKIFRSLGVLCKPHHI